MTLASITGGYGRGRYGLGPYGLVDTEVEAHLVSADAISEREVKVVFSSPPRALSVIGLGDVFNTSSWVVSRSDGFIYILQEITEVDDVTFVLYALEVWGDFGTTHTVDASGVYDASTGAPLVAPTTLDFFGCIFRPVSFPSKTAIVDLANTTFQNGQFGGTLSIGSDGDYAVESGTDLLKKLILRRLTTLPGEFFFADPSYGYGLQLQTPLHANDLVKMKAQIEREIAKEPEIAQATIGVSLTSTGILTITVKAKLQSTQSTVVIPIQVPSPITPL